MAQTIHQPLGKREWVFKLVKEWSCPIHEGPTTSRYIWDTEWDEEGQICLDCLFGSWQVVKDTDGWATMEFRPKTIHDHLWDSMFEELRAAVNRPSYGDLPKGD